MTTTFSLVFCFLAQATDWPLGSVADSSVQHQLCKEDICVLDIQTCYNTYAGHR